MTDQDVREIHLSRKELVFLFMASVVLAVVVFLLGVSVGRGVHSPATVAADAVAPSDTTGVVEPGGAKPPTTYTGRLGGSPTEAPPPVAAVPPPVVEPPAPEGTKTKAAAETAGKPAVGGTPAASAAKPAGAESTGAAAAAKPADTKPPATPPKPAAATSTSAKPEATPPAGRAAAAAKPAAPATGTWVVQVIALKTKERADAIVAQLRSKNYSAFVIESRLFNVRVGPFTDRADAEAARTRLAKDGYSDSQIVHIGQGG